MNTAVLIATLAVVGAFLAALLQLLALPQSNTSSNTSTTSGTGKMRINLSRHSGRRYHYRRSRSQGDADSSGFATVDGPLVKYSRPDVELSNEEMWFQRALEKAVNDTMIIFPKVCVANVFEPDADPGSKLWKRASGKISERHFDFVLCAADGSAVKLAIMVDDGDSYERQRAGKDSFLNDACESAGLPLLRVRAAHGYATYDVRTNIAAALSSAGAVYAGNYLSRLAA